MTPLPLPDFSPSPPSLIKSSPSITATSTVPILNKALVHSAVNVHIHSAANMADGTVEAPDPDTVPPPRRCLSRKIAPEDVTKVFDFYGTYKAFNLDEQLEFAIAFKQNPKRFDLIAESISGRSSEDCKDHYYQTKFDGRFKTCTWLETNEKHGRKKYAVLDESDRRMRGIPSRNNIVIQPKSRPERQNLAQLMQLIPINEEIYRLLDLLPGSEDFYASELEAAQNAQDIARGSITTAMQQELDLDDADEESAHEDDVRPFEDLSSSLEMLNTKLTSILKQLVVARESLAEAEDDYDPRHYLSEMNLLRWREIVPLYEEQLAWIDSSLKAMFTTVKIKSRPDDEVVCGELFRAMSSCQAGIGRIESDRKSLKTRFSRISRRKTPDFEQTKAIQEALDGREGQMAELQAMADDMRKSISSKLCSSEQDDEIMTEDNGAIKASEREDMGEIEGGVDDGSWFVRGDGDEEMGDEEMGNEEMGDQEMEDDDYED